MPGKGRPRLTPEVYEARVAAYCARYAVKATRDGLPPFPTGRRETPQHREWISLYKAHSRLARRARGICERCSEPVAPDSVFCDAHRAETAISASPAPATSEDRHRLLEAQNGRCPICAEPLDIPSDVNPDRATGPRARATGSRERTTAPQPDRPTAQHGIGTVHLDRTTGKAHGLLHARCARLVSLAEAAGPAALDRLRAYLRPQRTRTPRS